MSQIYSSTYLNEFKIIKSELLKMDIFKLFSYLHL